MVSYRTFFILFVLILGLLYFFNYNTQTGKLPINIKDILPAGGEIIQNISLVDYVNNVEKYDGQHVTLLGFLQKTDTEYLVDYEDNKIKLIGLRPPQRALFQNESKSTKAYSVRGILLNDNHNLTLQIRSIDDIPEKSPDKSPTVEIIPVKNESIGYFTAIKNKLGDLMKESASSEKEETISEEYSDSSGIKLPTYCFGNAVSLEQCNCPSGYVKKLNSCVKACTDGTIYSHCSEETHLFCNYGELFEDPERCGCPRDLFLWENECIPQEKYALLKTEAERIEKEERERIRIEKEKERALIAAKDGLDYVNQMRTMNGKSSISFDERVFNIGLARVKDMYEYNYMDHTNPITGSCPDSIKKEYGLSSGEYIAENAYGMWGAPASPRAAIDSWMTSRGHRYNLLYDDHTAGAVVCYGGYCVFLGLNRDRFGEGCFTGAEGTSFWNSVGEQPGEI